MAYAEVYEGSASTLRLALTLSATRNVVVVIVVIIVVTVAVVMFPMFFLLFFLAIHFAFDALEGAEDFEEDALLGVLAAGSGLVTAGLGALRMLTTWCCSVGTTVVLRKGSWRGRGIAISFRVSILLSAIWSAAFPTCFANTLPVFCDLFLMRTTELLFMPLLFGGFCHSASGRLFFYRFQAGVLSFEFGDELFGLLVHFLRLFFEARFLEVVGGFFQVAGAILDFFSTFTELSLHTFKVVCFGLRDSRESDGETGSHRQEELDWFHDVLWQGSRRAS